MKLLSIMGTVVLLAACALATPIRPDVQKMLDGPRTPARFVPARAGWNGSEMSKSADPAVLESLGAAARSRGVQQDLIEIATPDWRVFLALGLLIVLLRLLRRRATPAVVSASYPVPVDAIEPIKQRPAA